jgi:hypothetical protein
VQASLQLMRTGFTGDQGCGRSRLHRRDSWGSIRTVPQPAGREARTVGSDTGLRPFTASAKDGVLTIVIEREFDMGSLHQDWAVSILSMHPGPFSKVRMDMTKCGRVSSTFYAGLMQLHFAYNASGQSPITLVKPAASMVANLKILHLQSYFVIEA